MTVSLPVIKVGNDSFGGSYATAQPVILVDPNGNWAGSFGSSGSGPAPVTVIAASSASQALVWPTSTSKAVYDCTLTADCTLTLSGTPPAGEIELVLYLRQDSTAGHKATLPTGVKWAGQNAPVPNTVSGVIDRYVFHTPDSGVTVLGSF